ADLLVYGMGETPIVEIARRLAAGQSVRDLRGLRGVAYVLGARETPAVERVGGLGGRPSKADPSPGEGRSAGVRPLDASPPTACSAEGEVRSASVCPLGDSLATACSAGGPLPETERGGPEARSASEGRAPEDLVCLLPSFEEVSRDRMAFVEAT